MSIVYLVSDYGILRKEGETLKLFKEGVLVKTIFPFKTELLFIIGKIEMTSHVLHLLMKYKIPTVFIGKNGRYYGSLSFSWGKNVFARREQYRKLDQPEWMVQTVKMIVEGKVKNQLAFLQRLGRKESQNSRLDEAKIARYVITFKEMIEKINESDSIDSLRGYEGYCAKLYFEVLGDGFLIDWTSFKGRNMNPPLDPINAVLSFLYTIILHRVDAAIESLGLDPHVGYLHTLDYGKRSLSFDLMEEYRTAICDMTAMSLFNKNILKPEDFREVIFSTESDEFPLEKRLDIISKDVDILNEDDFLGLRGQEIIAEDSQQETVHTLEKRAILLNKDGLNKVLIGLEKRLNTEIYYQPIDGNIPYRELMAHQVKQFKNYLMGELVSYKPLKLQ